MGTFLTNVDENCNEPANGYQALLQDLLSNQCDQLLEAQFEKAKLHNRQSYQAPSRTAPVAPYEQLRRVSGVQSESSSDVDYKTRIEQDQNKQTKSIRTTFPSTMTSTRNPRDLMNHSVSNSAISLNDVTHKELATEGSDSSVKEPVERGRVRSFLDSLNLFNLCTKKKS